MLIEVKAAEAKLMETLNNIKDDYKDWYAVHFNFSCLLEHYQEEPQLKIAINMIRDFLTDIEGMIGLCHDSDILVIAKTANKAPIDKVVFQLRYLLMDDPLAYNVDNQENQEFCTVYSLLRDNQKFRQGLQNKLLSEKEADTGKKKSSKKELQKNGKRTTPKDSLKPFTPAKLDVVEKDLRYADLSQVIRRQSICSITGGGENGEFRPMFDELYINIAHLRQLVMEDVDLLSDRWLFKYMTKILDDRVLHLLKQRPTVYFNRPVSLNLNIETILSPAFTEFDRTIKPSTKMTIVLEIQVSDVFANIDGFLTAKDIAQKMGYRVCVDGLTPFSFTQIDREKLGFDLVKMQWNADAESDLRSESNAKLRKAVRDCGANRIILCRCDTENSVRYGQALGISLFQGRYIDKILDPHSTRVN
jgi:hypothetical protein